MQLAHLAQGDISLEQSTITGNAEDRQRIEAMKKLVDLLKDAADDLIDDLRVPLVL